MNFPSILCRSLLVATLLGLVNPGVRAQDTTPPVVVNPIGDLVLPVNSAPTVVKLKKMFGLTGVSGTLVRMTTNLGNIDLQLFSEAAPSTVANFLNYVDSGSYNNVIFHRVTTLADSGIAVIQGGESTLLGNGYSVITSFGHVNNEYSLPNTRGTIAMAKLGGNPDSATDQWFFNASDNSDALGSGNNGGFTVFGRVIGRGLQTVDAIGALPGYDLSSARYDWTSIPLVNYDPSLGAGPSNLVVANSVAVLPLISKGPGYPGAIAVRVKSNSNPALVTTSFKSRKLTLTYAPGQTGTATITLLAKGSGKSKINYMFNVTVQ